MAYNPFNQFQGAMTVRELHARLARIVEIDPDLPVLTENYESYEAARSIRREQIHEHIVGTTLEVLIIDVRETI